MAMNYTIESHYFSENGELYYIRLPLWGIQNVTYPSRDYPSYPATRMCQANGKTTTVAQTVRYILPHLMKRKNTLNHGRIISFFLA